MLKHLYSYSSKKKKKLIMKINQIKAYILHLFIKVLSFLNKLLNCKHTDSGKLREREESHLSD